MSYGDVAVRHENGSPPLGDRLSLGVAARLSCYLLVLTQAKKMGKETISSQELSDYTHVNSTQIRKILRTAGQHNIALFGAGHLGKAIASSDIFADHGFNIVGIFDNDPAKVGTDSGDVRIQDMSELPGAIRDRNVIVGVLAVPEEAAQEAADQLVRAGVKIIFNYSDALIDTPADVTVHRSSPVVEILHALYFHLT